jgi:trans-2,3-dihydro-3-hydroxyanthranilate isomerase
VRKLSYTVVDVFTDEALAGNPLAVFTNATGVEPALMQALARELNLSETAFLHASAAGTTARVRIFTPRVELPFAGHPLIGTAYVLGRSTPVPVVRFETGVGPIDVEIEREAGFVTRCVMTQPEPSWEDAPPAAAIEAALGVPLLGPPAVGVNGPRTLLAPVADLGALAPDLPAIERLGTTVVSAYAPPADGVVRCRVFAPAAGIGEDPATGAAAGPLAVHLLATGAIPAGRLEIRQGAEIGRPSVIEAEVTPGAPPRIGGGCVPVARGHFEI